MTEWACPQCNTINGTLKATPELTEQSKIRCIACGCPRGAKVINRKNIAPIEPPTNTEKPRNKKEAIQLFNRLGQISLRDNCYPADIEWLKETIEDYCTEYNIPYHLGPQSIIRDTKSRQQRYAEMHNGPLKTRKPPAPTNLRKVIFSRETMQITIPADVRDILLLERFNSTTLRPKDLMATVTWDQKLKAAVVRLQ